MTVKIGRMCDIHPTAKIEAEEVVIGDFTQIGENVRIHGKSVVIGRDAWIAPDVLIGGGRAEMGSLTTGDFLHLGMRSIVNIADDVIIGDEVGIGIESKLYTHGAYLNRYLGFPYDVGKIRIGNRVWIPNATVLPKAGIGNNVVIGAMSLVNKNVPSGCLAAGIPARIIREHEYPKKLSSRDYINLTKQVQYDCTIHGVRDTATIGWYLVVGKTTFIPDGKPTIEGPSNKDTELVKDIFRRHGVRFRYYSDGEMYREWD